MRFVRPDPLSEAEKQPLLKGMTPTDEQIFMDLKTKKAITLNTFLGSTDS